MMGWSEAAMIAGAKEVGVSPSIIGSFPRKGAALVEVKYTFIFMLCIICILLHILSTL